MLKTKNLIEYRSVTLSQGQKLGLLFSCLLYIFLLGSCNLYGPWNVSPNDPPLYKGPWINGYVIARKPIDNICIEKQLRLDEEHTGAFAFYKSAEVTVSGLLLNRQTSQTLNTVQLTPKKSNLNCFEAPDGIIPLAGNEYMLSVRLEWDSAHTLVQSSYSATTRIPFNFEINKTVKAPFLVAIENESETNLESFQNLFEKGLIPEAAQKEFIDKFGTGILTQETDSVANFLRNNLKEILGILNKYTINYQNGDSVYYLTGNFNTLSHYFGTKKDSGVGGIVVTQHWDSSALRPVNRFDGIAGNEPELKDFYYPGTKNRLLNYSGFKSDKFDAFDSMGVINTWFLIGKNTLYFYGMDDSYDRFISSITQAAEDPRIEILSNIKNGRGYFSGGIVDSFTVYIKAAKTLEAYSQDSASKAYCSSEGWYSNQSCRKFWLKMCTINPSDKACNRLNIYADIKNLDSLPDGFTLDFDNKWAIYQTCMEDYTDDRSSLCSLFTTHCIEEKKDTYCKEQWFDFCKLDNWSSPTCKTALVWYMVKNPKNSDILLNEAQKICTNQPSLTACKFLEK